MIEDHSSEADELAAFTEGITLPIPREDDGSDVPLDSHEMQLTRLEEKYRRSRKANITICVFAGAILVCALGFAYVTYISLLPSGATGELLINPYISDGKLTQLYMDTDLDPCEDFVGYSMKKWIDAVNLTNGTNRESLVFEQAQSNVTQLIKQILEERWPYLSPFYKSCQALPSYLPTRFLAISSWAMRINGAGNATQLFRYLSKLRNETGIDLKLMFSLSVWIDPTSPTQYIYTITANGFSLPSKPHYADPVTLLFYRNWIQTMFQMIGFPLSAQRIDNILAFEQQTAAISMTVDELYDPLETSNHFNQSALQDLLRPSLYAYVQDMKLSSGARFLVDDVGFFRNLTLPNPEVLRDIALLRLLKLTLPLQDLQGQALVSNYTQYFGGAASKDYCQELSTKYLGWLISRYYEEIVYVPSDKTRVAEISQLLREKLKTLVGLWTWMDDESRQQALLKYDTLQVLAAYPDQWPDFDQLFLQSNTLPLSDTSLLDNVLKLERAYDYQILKRINEVVKRDDWLMTPVTVNAYYEPSTNTIVLPLAIEQEPFLSSGQPYAANLAMFWAVFTHEAFHAIDSTGALYDSTGRLTEWMSVYSRNVFNTKVQCIEEQFSEFTVISSQHHLNGKLVSGEAMADLNGLKLCYSLLQEFILTQNATWDQDVKWIDDAYGGLTMEQLFFVKYAQLWAYVISPSYALELSRSDPHPLPEDRVLGTLSNMDAFSKAFNCPSGSKYNPRDKCSMD